jgi:RNA polymerase sigma-70 factor (ECF subfamily)
MSRAEAFRPRAPESRVLQMYRAHGSAVRARCRRLLGDEQAADDATQETFVRVIRHLVAAPPDAEALKWLYRIATNLCFNELRNAKNAARSFERSGTLEKARLGSIEDGFAHRDLARHIFVRLPETVRAISVLRHIHGMGQDEVADALGMSRRTVVYRLAQFREDAQRMLAQLDT